MKSLFLFFGLGASISCWTVNSCLGQSFWDNNLGGDFHFPGNWIPGPPGPNDEAIFQIPGTAYTITFMTTANSGSVTVQDGEVTFDLFDPGLGLQTYNVDGNVSIMLPLSDGSPTSLTVNEGNLNATGAFQVFDGATLIVNGILDAGAQSDVFDGATLNGDGVVNANGLNIQVGGTLRGNLNINTQSSVNNRGLVSPGLGTSGAEIGTLNIANTFGNFQGFPDSTIEIQISGATPVAMSDVINYSSAVFGNVNLDGGLRIGLIDNYLPQINDSFTFLNSTSAVNGQFKGFSVSGLTGNVAAQVNYTPNTASITFVTASVQPFIPGALSPIGPNFWGNPNFWGGGTVPDSTNTVSLINNRHVDLIIELSNETQNPADAIALTHFTTLSGTTNTMTLSVPAGTNFTAVKELNINNNGILNLDGGTVHSNLVKIEPGGLLKGDGGTINGTLQVGTNIPSSIPAVFSPGNSPGTTTINGDLEINSNGMLDIDVENMNSFDLVVVSQTADLGGTLNVVASAIPPLPTDGSMGVTILTAANVDQKFENVMTTSTSDFYFAPRYDSGSVSLLSFLDGDMNQNGARNSEDVMWFAMAVTDPDGYFDLFDMYGEGSGDINDDGFFDFDDIEPFSQLSGIGLTAEEIVAVIESFQQPVPEPTTFLGFCLALGSLVASRRLSSNRSSKAA